MAIIVITWSINPDVSNNIVVEEPEIQKLEKSGRKVADF